MIPVILTGYRPHPYHDENWRYCRRYWERELGWPTYAEDDESDPFSMSRASNAAANTASWDVNWDVALYCGVDFFLEDSDQARTAAVIALHRGQLVFAHDHQWMLGQETSEKVLKGRKCIPDPDVDSGPAPNTFSGVLAFPRKLWEEVGGFDERFVGWGFEDLGFFEACWSLANGFQRVPGALYHLHHPRSWDENEGNPHHEDNRQLWERYRKVKHNRNRMLDLLREPGAPLCP